MTEQGRAAGGHCRICGSRASSRFSAKEMMFGLREEFDYRTCLDCGSVQIAEIPADLSRYYESRYYSLEPEPRASLIRRMSGPVLRSVNRQRVLDAYGRATIVGRILRLARPGRIFMPWWLVTTQPPSSAPILDVGCGQGRVLRKLHRLGYSQLTGIDPMLTAIPSLPRGIRIVAQDLSAVGPENPFSVILFDHSLEHVRDPVADLCLATRMLDPKGFVVIRTPIAATYAANRFREYWVQLDPPRHLHVFSLEGLRIAAARAGLAIARTKFDSGAFQFWGSLQYERGIPLSAPDSYLTAPDGGLFSKRQIHAFENAARELNRTENGDQATVLLVRAERSG